MRLSLKALCAALVFVAAACSDSTSSGADGTGPLTVRMTDAPFPFGQVASVNIHVVRIDARLDDPSENEAEDADEMDGWTTIATPDEEFDLLDLQNGVTANLGSATLPTGTYHGFRLIIDPDRSGVVLNDGSTPDVMWPSAAQTGIKIKLDEAIELTEDGSVMILDFDIGRSFIMRGNSISQNGLLFKPVIRAVATDVTGSVEGVVRTDTPTGNLLTGATVEVLTLGSLLDDDDPEHIVATTVTDANGAFRISFLLPGSYVLRVTPLASSGYQPTLLSGGFTLDDGEDLDGVVVVVTTGSGS